MYARQAGHPFCIRAVSSRNPQKARLRGELTGVKGISASVVLSVHDQRRAGIAWLHQCTALQSSASVLEISA